MTEKLEVCSWEDVPCNRSVVELHGTALYCVHRVPVPVPVLLVTWHVALQAHHRHRAWSLYDCAERCETPGVDMIVLPILGQGLRTVGARLLL